MTNAITLDLIGLLWKHLLIFERNEILKQMPSILKDLNRDRYRYIKSIGGSWTITNAMSLPLKCNTMGLNNG